MQLRFQHFQLQLLLQCLRRQLQQLLHPLFPLQLVQAALVATVPLEMAFVPTLFFAVHNGDIVGQVQPIALRLRQLQLLALPLHLRRLAEVVAMAQSGTVLVPILSFAVRNGDIVGQGQRIVL